MKQCETVMIYIFNFSENFFTFYFINIFFKLFFSVFEILFIAILNEEGFLINRKFFFQMKIMGLVN